MKLLLASSSPRRRDILTQIGVRDFEVYSPNVDETPLDGEGARVYAVRMAREKAHSVPLQDGWGILSADTVVCTSRKILPKAQDADTARACITYLRGRRHMVYTGMCFRTSDTVHTKAIKTIVQFKNLDMGEVRDYVAYGDWGGKAGGYAIQGYASRYVSAIMGSYSAVVGLDAHTVYKWLRQYGIVK